MKNLASDHRLERVNPLWAISGIRNAVLRRQHGRCIKCDGEITKETMHLDEYKNRGRGGLISLDNCQALCSDCHIGPRGKHGLERSPRFGNEIRRGSGGSSDSPGDSDPEESGDSLEKT